MKDVGISFKILEEDEHLPVGYKNPIGDIIFIVNMDFIHKSRWVKDGHHTPNPTTPNYAGVLTKREHLHPTGTCSCSQSVCESIQHLEFISPGYHI